MYWREKVDGVDRWILQYFFDIGACVRNGETCGYLLPTRCIGLDQDDPCHIGMTQIDGNKLPSKAEANYGNRQTGRAHHRLTITSSLWKTVMTIASSRFSGVAMSRQFNRALVVSV
jgi:hypothetical protein